jgi:hypothetical protein
VNAQNAFDAAFNPALTALDNAGWTATTARRDARQAAQVTYQDATRTANDTFLTSYRAAVAADLTAQKATAFNYNNAVWSANQTVMAAQEAHKAALRQATTQAERDAADATLRDANKAYAVAVAQAALTREEARRTSQTPLLTQQQDALGTKADAQASALKDLRVAWATADQTFTATVSGAVKTFQDARADAAATLTKSLASSAATRQGSVGDAERDWNKALAAAAQEQTTSVSQAVGAWKTAEASADGARRLSEAQAAQTAGASVGAAAQTLQAAETAAFSTWTSSLNAAETAFSGSVNAAGATFDTTQAQAEAAWSAGLASAAATRDAAVVSSLTAERQATAAAQRWWLLAVSDARSAEAAERVAARVKWVATPPVPGVTPPAEAYADQDRHAGVGEALAAAAASWDAAEGTAWSEFGAAEAGAWRDWAFSGGVPVRDWKVGRAEDAEAWAGDALDAWLNANDATSTAWGVRANAEAAAWGAWVNTASAARTAALTGEAQASATYTSAVTQSEATRETATTTAENTFQTAATQSDAQRQAAVAAAVIAGINAETAAYLVYTSSESAAAGLYAGAESALSQALEAAWAAADMTFVNATEDANATRIRSAWQAWRTFADGQADAEAGRTKGDATAAQSFKTQVAALDVALVSGLAAASKDRRVAVTLAEKADSLRRSAVEFDLAVAGRQLALAEAQARPASEFAGVAVVPQVTEWRKIADVLRSFGGDWADGVSNMLDYLSDGRSTEVISSKAFGRTLDAVDGFFAGWAHGLTAGLSTRLRTKMYGELATRNHEGFWFNVGSAVGMVHSLVLNMSNPCALGAVGQWGYRGVMLLEGGGHVANSYEHFQKGEYLFGVLEAVGALGSFANMFRACFEAGTPINVEGGSKRVEEVTSGDRVWSRSEHDPEGPLELKEVAQTFVRVAGVWDLYANGRKIGTTEEHPFFVDGQGWTPTRELKAGDRIRTREEGWVKVDRVEDTGRFSVVYNFKVSEFHTYFVGCEDWGFSVWSHNLDCTPRELIVELKRAKVIGEKAGDGRPSNAMRAALAGDELTLLTYLKKTYPDANHGIFKLSPHASRQGIIAGCRLLARFLAQMDDPSLAFLLTAQARWIST